MALIGAFITGCQNDKEPENTPAAAKGVTVTLNMEIESEMHDFGRSESANPAPRRLMTWTPAHAINDLRIYVFKGDTADGEYYYVGGGDGEDGGYIADAYKFTFSPTLEEGKYYKFLAVGRDDATGQAAPTVPIGYIKWGTKTLGNAQFEVGQTELHEATISNSLHLTHYPYVTTEIFTGILMTEDEDGNHVEDYLMVDAEAKSFNKNLKLQRAVAGLWLYLTGIPSVAVDNSDDPRFNGVEFYPDELTVHMSRVATSLQLASKTGVDITDGNSPVQVGYVDFSNRYGEIREKLWYRDEENKVWRREQIDNYRGVTIAADCAFISNFMFPFVPADYLAGGQAILKVQLRQYHTDYTMTRKMRCYISSAINPNTGESVDFTCDVHQFPILSSCIYALGTPETPFNLMTSAPLQMKVKK